MMRVVDQAPARAARARRPVAPGGISVVLVDGVPLFREGLSALIMRTPGLRWIGAADGVQGAMQLSERFRPNVVLVDSALDPRNQLSRTLISSDVEMAVVLLVSDAHRTTQYVGNGIAAGVHGLLPRSVEPVQLVEAVRAVYDGRSSVKSALAQVVAAPGYRSPQHNGEGQHALSRREYQLLHLIADGLENQAIAKILYV